MNTNSLGFKDSQSRTVPLKKNNPRILLIGDSFTEGIGYAHNDTFAGILEKKLETKNIEVFNAGVSSYSPIIYLRKTQFLIDKGFEFDHLAVFIDISGIEDEAKNYTFDKKICQKSHDISIVRLKVIILYSFDIYNSKK